MLEKSWAQAFSDHIFTRTNEYIFAPLYSEKTNSRPNVPVNVVVGALILKDDRKYREVLNGWTNMMDSADHSFYQRQAEMNHVHEHKFF